MEESLEGPQIPQTDSIKELAEFWDTHEITDFEEQLEEVDEPEFLRLRSQSGSPAQRPPGSGFPRKRE